MSASDEDIEEVIGVVEGSDINPPEETTVQIGPGAEQIKEEEAEENTGLELGDLVEFHSTKPDIETVRGRIYYIDDTRVSILEDGKSRKITVFDMEEDEDGDMNFKADYMLTGADILEKRLLPSFVAQRGMARDMIIETFTADGDEVKKYKIVSVNEIQDSAEVIAVDEELNPIEGEEPLLLPFAYKGIPRDGSEVPFAVLRVVEPPKKEDVVPNEAAPGEVEDEVIDFEFLDDMDAPDDEEELVGLFQAFEKPAWLIEYDDDQQINDMLRERIRDLDAAAQRNPKQIRAVTRHVWNMLTLRNDITKYSGGKPIGRKPVAFNTLFELLERTEFPLAKKVLSVSKGIYVDHRYAEKEKGGGKIFIHDDPSSLSDPQITLHYLENDVISGNRYLETQLKDSLQVQTVAGQKIPRWITVWQGYYNRYFVTYLPKDRSEDTKDIKYDQDFFREDLPKEEKQYFTVSGFPILDSDADTLVSFESLRKVPYSFGRVIGPRFGRYGEGGLTHKIEDADAAQIKGYLLFPLKYNRDLGYIRSGILILDSVNSMARPMPMYSILKDAGEVVDIPEANKIISVSFDGSTLGNTEVADWLKGQAIYGGGIGDLMPTLRSFGLLEAEFTIAQKKVLDTKCTIYRLAVKKMLKEARDNIKKSRESRKPIETSLLTDKQRFFEMIQQITNPTSGEPILKQMLEDFRLRHPSYNRFDVATYAYMYNYYPDLLLNCLAQNPDVAKERLRAERDIFIREVLDRLEGEKKLEDRGETPHPNPCQHMKDLNKIRKVENDTERMMLLNTFVRSYTLKKENHWLWCNNGEPPHHLLCEHEYLLLQEFLRPKEKDVIHKEIILTFSGGKFNGQYICKQCGQPISEYEYDTHLEYDDQGRPMSGRAVLVDEDAIQTEAFQRIFTTEAEEEEKVETKTEEDQKIYTAINEIAALVGIFPDRDSYIQMIGRVRNELSLLTDRKKYSEMQAALVKAGKKPTDYDMYVARILVSLCGAALLIDVQTKVPDYLVRYTLSGCKNPSFTGYPRDPDDSNPKIGMEYIACAISTLTITKTSYPWNITGFITQKSDDLRLKDIFFLLELYTKKLATNPAVQQDIIDKKQYLLETFGFESALGRPQDKIPFGFTPTPYNPSKELSQESEEPVIAETASEPEKVRAYIKQAHMFALKYGKYMPGVSFSEASCCYNDLLKPGDFWLAKGNLPELDPPSPPKGSSGSVLFVTMKPRPVERLFAQADASIMYRLFLRVCFRGPRKGEQHEPGYDNTCPWCEFKFPDDPRDPPPSLRFSKDGKTQKKYDDEYQSEVQAKQAKELQALREAGIDEVKKDNFEELLNSVNQHSIIPSVAPPSVPSPMANLKGMLSLLPKPFDEYVEVLRATNAALEALPPNATRKDLLQAFNQLSDKAVTLENELRSRLGDATFVEYQEMVKLEPQELGETLRTYFLIPFQRITIGVQKFSFNLRPSAGLEFSREVKADINESFDRHTSYLNEILKDLSRSDVFVKAKIKEVANKLSVVIPVFIKTLRPTAIRGGNIASMFLQRAIVAGIFTEFIMPNHIPPNETGLIAPTSAITVPAKLPAKILQACLVKYKTEGLGYSKEQIRELIEDRAEKEKSKIIRDKDTLTPEERKLDNMLQNLGMGQWAVGGSAAIRKYDPNQYVSEREAMLSAGISRFGPQVDAYEAEGGYDVQQTSPDDA